MGSWVSIPVLGADPRIPIPRKVGRLSLKSWVQGRLLEKGKLPICACLVLVLVMGLLMGHFAQCC